MQRAQLWETEEATRMQLADAEEHYRRPFDGSTVAILAMDQRGMYRQCNAATEALFGFTSEELAGRPAGALSGANSTTAQDVLDLAASPSGWHGEFTITRKDGRKVPIEVSIMRVSKSSGFAYIALLQDLSAIRAAQEAHLTMIAETEARTAAEQLVRERDQFLSIAAHELRTPVAGIRGYAELLQRALGKDVVDADRLQRYSEAMLSGTTRLTRLTNDLLDISRLPRDVLPIRLSPVDLTAIVLQEAARYHDLLPRKLALSVETIPCIIIGDLDRLDQVLINLLENAIKYSPEGGTITVNLRIDGTDAVLDVTDQGIGLPEGSQTAIFKPFVRGVSAAASPVAGIGLGLYICQHIVLAHGGSITATSPGETLGTTFTVRLPIQGPSEL